MTHTRVLHHSTSRASIGLFQKNNVRRYWLVQQQRQWRCCLAILRHSKFFRFHPNHHGCSESLKEFATKFFASAVLNSLSIIKITTMSVKTRSYYSMVFTPWNKSTLNCAYGVFQRVWNYVGTYMELFGRRGWRCSNVKQIWILSIRNSGYQLFDISITQQQLTTWAFAYPILHLHPSSMASIFKKRIVQVDDACFADWLPT